MEKYNLVGVVNLFSVIPGFVIPIFIKDGNYYTMNADMETKETIFIKIPIAYNDSIISLNDLSVDYLNTKNVYSESDEIIGAFQLDNNEVIIGQLNLLIRILKEYETDNVLLQKEIIDYINEMNYYISQRNNKKGR